MRAAGGPLTSGPRDGSALDTRQMSRICSATNVADRERCSGVPVEMAHRKIDRLTRREREIINTMFALGNRASVEDIRSRLVSPPSDSSVRVMLARLETKGIVRRQADGIRNIYSVTVPAAAAKRTALQQYLQTFFGGSVRLMLTSLVREGSFSDGDLAALRAEIDKARKEKKKP